MSLSHFISSSPFFLCLTSCGSHRLFCPTLRESTMGSFPSLHTQFIPSMCCEIHWRMAKTAERRPSNLSRREIRRVLSYQASFHSQFSSSFSSCRGCRAPLPFSHVKLLRTPERRRLSDPRSSTPDPPPLTAKPLAVRCFLKATSQLPQSEGILQQLPLHLGPAKGAISATERGAGCGATPQSTLLTHCVYRLLCAASTITYYYYLES